MCQPRGSLKTKGWAGCTCGCCGCGCGAGLRRLFSTREELRCLENRRIRPETEPSGPGERVRAHG